MYLFIGSGLSGFGNRLERCSFRNSCGRNSLDSVSGKVLTNTVFAKCVIEMMSVNEDEPVNSIRTKQEQMRKNQELFNAFLKPSDSGKWDSDSDSEIRGRQHGMDDRQRRSYKRNDDHGRDRGRRSNSEKMYPVRRTVAMDVEERLQLAKQMKLEKNKAVRVYIERLTPLGARVAVSLPEKELEALEDKEFKDGVCWLEGALLASEMRTFERDLRAGDELTAYLVNVRDDGKIDLTLRQIGTAGRDISMNHIRNLLNESHGVLNITDGASSEEIVAVFGMSKKKFKQALGGLLKNCEVIVEDGAIRATSLLQKVEESA
uniref:Conserved virulence factor B-like winged helix domain-containing protein n=1 Tax=Timspurckia oligopyrenoides TaxID=708627 RepID=A0A7S1ETK5_9RHOD|mmetsp:Transcript_6875/g.12302  ORF Transcript_6875/g.12302 Transcript_6875/m.12302 type:complete len:318 (+) Transcript_6875:60-1013(+)